MKRITTFDLSPDYRTLKVWDASFESTPGWDLTDGQRSQRHQQELAARRWKSLSFTTLGDCMGMTIEVWYADAPAEMRLKDDTIRAILVPFFCESGLWRIGNVRGCVTMTLSTYPGDHALLFEVKLRNDQEYLSSPQYQEDIEGGFSQEYCYLTLCQRREAAEPIQPEVLRVDARSAPLRNFANCEQLDRSFTYPSAYWFDW